MNKLLCLCNDLGIDLSTADMPHTHNGFCYQNDGYSAIVINNKLDEKHLKEVLAHEVGHYLNDIMTNAFFIYSEYVDILHRKRNEERAIRWATNYLINTEDLLAYLRSTQGLKISTLSEHFEVSEETITMKFFIMSLEKLTRQLDDTRSLVLSDLPSVYIFDSKE